MSGLNWKKAKADTSMRSHGAVDKATDRERRENDRAAKWLAKVEASKSKKGRK